MALWRVLDLYKRDASRRGQAPAKQTHWTRIKRSTLEPSETGRSPLNRLANRPVILRSSAIFWVFVPFLSSEYFRLRFVSVGVFLRRPFLLPQKPFFTPAWVWLYSLKTSKIHAKPISTHSRFLFCVWYNRRCYNDITFWYISVTLMSLCLPNSRGIVVTQSNSQRRIARIASRVFKSGAN